VRLFTIGFTRKSARDFFGLLRDSGVRRVIDVRLKNVSQLAGFAKRDDIEYFLQTICGADYVAEPLLAPEASALEAYRKKALRWDEYETGYRDLLKSRGVERVLDRGRFDEACLLCSEHEPDQCHRRIAAEYLEDQWTGLEVVHLVDRRSLNERRA